MEKEKIFYWYLDQKILISKKRIVKNDSQINLNFKSSKFQAHDKFYEKQFYQRKIKHETK